MSYTTTLRLSDDLKARLADAAERAGITPHALMVEAIAERVADEERRRDFVATAEARYAEFLATGEGIEWDEMRRYLEACAAGEQPPLPTPRTLPR